MTPQYEPSCQVAQRAFVATAAGLVSLILAGYAIGSVFAGASPAAVWPLLAAAALGAVLRGVLGMLTSVAKADEVAKALPR